MESLLVDRNELWEFLSWLPSIDEKYAYELILMIRSTGLREKYGFKGSDHKLMSKVVHGYLNAKVSGVENVPGEVELWRLRIYEEVERLALLGKSGVWHYVKYKAGSNTIVENVYTIPWELIALLISINPSSVMRAALSTVRDIEEAVWSMAEGRGVELIKGLFRRPDERYHANIMRHTVTRFHTIDIDDASLAGRVLELVSNEFGFKPATIKTRRGFHILVNLVELKERQLINKWVGRKSEKIARIHGEYKKTANIKPDSQRVHKLREELEEYVWSSCDPLFHRFNIASTLYKNERGGPLIEIKKKPIEPVPGTLYKGITVKFSPEEY